MDMYRIHIFLLDGLPKINYYKVIKNIIKNKGG